MAPVLKAAVIDGGTLCESASRIIALSHDFDLFPALVQAAENRERPKSTAVLAAVSQLVYSLHRSLVEWSSGPGRSRHDPTFTRRSVVATLNHSLEHYARHERKQLLEAFLLLAPSSDTTVIKILHDPRHACHAAMRELLVTETAPGIIDLLISLLRDTDAPVAALKALARRTDRLFVERLLRELKHPVPLRAVHNMKHLSSVAWLESRREELLELDGWAQAVAVELAAASSIGRESLFALLAMLLKDGLAEGRRASCNALAKFTQPEADQLVREALEDPDAGVQAAAVRQLRRRGFPDALALLVSCLDSRSIEVRDAARSSLAEFNFVRFRAMFDLLDEKSARATGVLVHKVDYSSRDGLIGDLESPSMAVRLRGIEMAVAMEAVDDVVEQLILVASKDHLSVRHEAITALGHCDQPPAVEALNAALQDPNQSIRDAAAASLERLQNPERSAPLDRIAIAEDIS
jgi:hypothetical protein